jgi:predicted enzyme related to lactoylglutathione lyase
MMNAINWFEIPVTDLERAATFYETTLGIALKRVSFGGAPIAIFPADEPGVAGALVIDARRKPGVDGSVVYLNATGKLDECLKRATRAGGEVILPRTPIGEPGFIAFVRDTEGNRIGLHAPA